MTNQHTPMGDELDRVLEDLVRYIERGEANGRPVHFVGEYKARIQAHIANHYVPKAQVIKDIAEIIGESVPHNIHYHLQSRELRSQNNLRDFQRKLAVAKGYDVTGKDE